MVHLIIKVGVIMSVTIIKTKERCTIKLIQGSCIFYTKKFCNILCFGDDNTFKVGSKIIYDNPIVQIKYEKELEKKCIDKTN